MSHLVLLYYKFVPVETPEEEAGAAPAVAG